LEGVRFGPGKENRKSPRAKVVLLVALPTALLGATYFLFVEYVLQHLSLTAADQRLTLRVGGLALAALALILSAACGYLLADRMARPIRLLLRLAESGEMPAHRASPLHQQGTEIYDLFRLVGVLVNQNKAGARALEELEKLREALALLREQVSQTGQHGVLPPAGPLAGGPLQDIGSGLDHKRRQLLAFFRELRQQVVGLRVELLALGDELRYTAADHAGSPVEAVLNLAAGAGGETPRAEPGPAVPGRLVPVRAPQAEEAIEDDAPWNSVHRSLDRLQQMGTVLVIEAARVAGARGIRVEDLYGRFRTGLGDLEQLVIAALGRQDAAGSNGDSQVIAEKKSEGSDRSGTEGTEMPVGPDGRQRWERLLAELDALERFLGEVDVG